MAKPTIQLFGAQHGYPNKDPQSLIAGLWYSPACASDPTGKKGHIPVFFRHDEMAQRQAAKLFRQYIGGEVSPLGTSIIIGQKCNESLRVSDLDILTDTLNALATHPSIFHVDDETLGLVRDRIVEFTPGSILEQSSDASLRILAKNTDRSLSAEERDQNLQAA